MFNPAAAACIRLDRRKFLAAASGLIAAGLLPRAALALASPHSFKHGAFDVTVLSDGSVMLPLGLFPDATPEELKALLGPMVSGDKATFQINPVVLRSGSDLILFDTGPGPGFQDTAGKLAESLKAAGIEPAQVTKVIYTHAHPDHFWGSVLADGKQMYPNATHHFAEAEWNFWTAKDLASKMPKDMQGMVTNGQAKLDTFKDKVSFFKPGSEVVSGIAAIDTSGHTPGHVSFELAGGDGLIIVGDAITNPQVFFAHPEWKFGFDADPATAITNRKKLLDMAAAGKKKLIGYHWTYPGVGMAEAKDGAYVYVAG